MFGEKLIIGGVFMAGILSFFAPCTFPLIPVYLGILSDEKGEYKRLKIGNLNLNIGAVIKTLSFILGLSTSFVILGFSAGFIGRFLANKWITTLAGIVVIILGLHQMEVINIQKLNLLSGIQLENNKTKALGTYITGLSFSLGWTPCVGPVLGAVLALSANSKEALYGAFLMFIYTCGLAIPFLIMLIASDYMMSKFVFIKRNLILIKRIGGILVVVMGIFLMTNKISSITAFIENFIK